MNRTAYTHRVVRASAGSGKTHQLTSHYLSLLADGAEPDTILATTFTRKAAGEILDRVLERLATAASDADKAAELAAQIGMEQSQQGFGAVLRSIVRRLHRVRVGTLDSFYIALASSFSLELGLPIGWSICDETDNDILWDDALDQLLVRDPDQIGRLLPLLSRGEWKRSVHSELLRVIEETYESYRGSPQSAWVSVQVPEPVAEERVQAALAQLRDFDFSTCGHKGFSKARDTDIAKFEGKDWLEFVGKGLAAKVLAGETTYHKKEIPSGARSLYETLVRHARSRAVQALADETRATWSLLDSFHRELWTAKEITGGLRFQEVTQALVEAVGRQDLPMDAMAFRLDGELQHLLLDEFQDTSLSQWRVLEPMARAITQSGADRTRSFFCVGDVKQAIYGWRGGMAEIFQTLQNSLGQVEETTLSESRRSAQPIIDVVNAVFGRLAQLELDDNCAAGLAAWGRRFEEHTTFKKVAPGYVELHAGPAQNGRRVGDQRADHCRYVARRIQDLVEQVPDRSIGVLCRRNETVARMIFELRRLGIEASEEGGNPLTDSAAVEVMLSLFTLADHPGNSVVWFHLKNSPLRDQLGDSNDPASVARLLRRELLADGYGSFAYQWAQRLAPACDRRDLSRLQQLVEMAYDFQSRSTLRAADFVRWVRQQRVPDPSSARVRAMTIHAAKGLQFDIVVLPELDTTLQGQPPPLVVGRHPVTLDVNFVCRYANDGLRGLLTDGERLVFEREQQHRVEESLSLLYVAMTRAVHALHMFIPGPRDGRSVRKDAWYNLLSKSITKGSDWTENTRIFEHGDPKWFKTSGTVSVRVADARPDRPERIVFLSAEADRRRGLEHIAPSRQEDQGRVSLRRLFDAADGFGQASGTLHHAWFALVDWLDNRIPEPAEMRAAAERLRAELPEELWQDYNRLTDQFRSYLANPSVSAVLRRAAYSGPGSPGFPESLAPHWAKSLVPHQVERERRFLVRVGSTFWHGSLDRIVWLVNGDQTVAADVIDFKTDSIRPGDAAALKARTNFYRPQLEAYRQAVARLAGLREECVAARLVFTEPGCIVGL